MSKSLRQIALYTFAIGLLVILCVKSYSFVKGSNPEMTYSSYLPITLSSQSRVSPNYDSINYDLDTAYLYEWEASINSTSVEESVNGVQEDQTGFNVKGVVAINALEKQGDGYLMSLSINDLDVMEKTENVSVADENSDIYSELHTPLYFTQLANGEITEVFATTLDNPEVINMQLGILEGMNIQIQHEESYTLTEADVIGSYQAEYSTEHLATTVIINKVKDDSSYMQRSASLDNVSLKSQQNSEITFDKTRGIFADISAIENSVILSSLDDNAIIDEDYATMTVSNEGYSNFSFLYSEASPAAVPVLADLHSLSLQERLDESGYTVDNELLIQEKLAELSVNSEDPRVLTELVMAIQSDHNAIALIKTYLAKNQVTILQKQAIASALVGVGTTQAQILLAEEYLSDETLDQETLNHVILATSLLESPDLSVVKQLQLLSQSDSPVRESAILSLGSAVSRITVSHAELAENIVSSLESKLELSRDAEEITLHLHALGNAAQDRSIDVVSRYLTNSSTIVQGTAVEALRSMPSTRVEDILLDAFMKESNDNVKTMIALTQAERSENNINARSAMPPILVNWTWRKVFGNSTINATASARVFIDADPFYAIAEGKINAKAWSINKEIVKARLLTEESGNNRKFGAYFYLMGKVVKQYEKVIPCRNNRSAYLVAPKTYGLFSVRTPGIPVLGIFTLRLYASSSATISVAYTWSYDACSSLNASAGITPKAILYVDGSAGLSLWVVRGGLGVGATINLELPATVSASYKPVTNKWEACYQLDLNNSGNARLYYWYQFRRWTGRWKSRKSGNLWSTTLYTTNRTISQRCFVR